MSVWVNPDIAEIIAGLRGVHAEVIATARRGARILKATIARDTGAMARNCKADVLGDKDAFFGIKDEGIIGYNYGHFNKWADREVPGSHVIERTIAQL